MKMYQNSTLKIEKNSVNVVRARKFTKYEAGGYPILGPTENFEHA
jgi:hypothetical protein